MTLGIAVMIVGAMWVVILAGLVTWFFVARARRRRGSQSPLVAGKVPGAQVKSSPFEGGQDETLPIDLLPVAPLADVPLSPRGGRVSPDEPFGMTTQEEYERLAAESFQTPPAAALGDSRQRTPFSWPEVTPAASAGGMPPVPPVPVSLPAPPKPRVSDAEPGDPVRSRGRADQGTHPSDALDRTIVAARPALDWNLVLPDGEILPLEADVVIGRRPVAVAGSSVLLIPDPTRTLSKSHVRMRAHGDRWFVTDLGSTNGLWLLHESGVEEPLPPHREVEATPRMRFGTLTVDLRRGVS